LSSLVLLIPSFLSYVIYLYGYFKFFTLFLVLFDLLFVYLFPDFLLYLFLICLIMPIINCSLSVFVQFCFLLFFFPVFASYFPFCILCLPYLSLILIFYIFSYILILQPFPFDVFYSCIFFFT